MGAVTRPHLMICKLMAGELSHVTYIGGIKEPHPYHFTGYKLKKKTRLKGSLCVAYCDLEMEFNFWKKAAACQKLCPSKNGALFCSVILTFMLSEGGGEIRLGDPTWGRGRLKSGR